jgi:CRISPR-associated protein Cas2
MSSGASDEHLYIVTYDIGDAGRWRAVFRLMRGYGEWMQLSVFQCRLTRMRHVELTQRLVDTIDAGADHVLIVDLGPADKVEPRVQSLGKRGFEPIEKVPVIV